MKTTVSIDTALQLAELSFPNQEHLSKAVAGGTSYQVGDQVFIIFILAEEDGCTICWSRGDFASEPIGESFTRYLWFPSLQEAKGALAKVESIVLKTLAAETESNA